MTTRVSVEEVKLIISTTIGDPAVFEHIEVASHLVDDLLVGKGLSTERLRDVELYLSAHFVAIRDQDAGQITDKTVDTTTATYGGDLGVALSFTRYGQQALALDTSGTLTSVGKARAQFRVFG